jgi:hypothetical protein
MNTPATPAQIRKHFKESGFEIHISRDGHIKFRRNRDVFPGAPTAWLHGTWVSEYHVTRDGRLYGGR